MDSSGLPFQLTMLRSGSGSCDGRASSAAAASPVGAGQLGASGGEVAQHDRHPVRVGDVAVAAARRHRRGCREQRLARASATCADGMDAGTTRAATRGDTSSGAA